MDKILHFLKRCIPKKLFKALQPVYHFLLSWFSAVWYRVPSEKLIVIGVTGTTGKTTSVYLIAKMLESAGYRVGYTSTAMFSNGEKEWLNDKKMTMIGRFFTQKILRQMVKNKCQYVIIETTSEGIVQYRHRFINYDILIFTGLYEEHIDSHGSFENYKQAKGKLFAHLKNCKTKYVNEQKYVCKSDTGIKKIDLNRVKKVIIANGDDENADYFLGFKAEEKYEVSAQGGPASGWRSMKFPPEADEPRAQEVRSEQNEEYFDIKKVIASDVDVNSNGTSFMVNNMQIDLQLLGEFNIANAMTAVCLGLAQGLEMKQIKKGLESVKGVPGRLEKIDAGQNFIVIVDYAFEPKAVAKLYETIELIPHNKIIHVLGSAGGGRDVARRPKLGKLAGEKADYVIVTNEDPYDDDPQIIIDQVAVGTEHVGKKVGDNLFKILDRRKAIKKALSLAKENDIVLITGKGSEQAICVADGEKIKWDDREVAREEINRFKI
ncbi:UDP-N-acetylmuramyl-tripeptide synthetase [Candidatus Parcubacteria bacterium]|nr:UDP-N-acetylmuramyl-tripeptide synthetase [Candidatus Parcubacteria bacterium]